MSFFSRPLWSVIFTICFFHLSAVAWASVAEPVVLEEIPEDWTQFSEDQIIVYKAQRALFDTRDRMQNLAFAKSYLISGNTEKARFFLNRIDQEGDPQIQLIKKRYLALIAFIEDRPEQTYEILSQKEFQGVKTFPHTCMLQVLSQLGRPLTPDFDATLSRCQGATSRYSTNEQYWLSNLEKLKQNNQKEIRGTILSDVQFILSSQEILRIWLKTGLYFNQEQLILNHMETLTESLLRSARARELIGLLYYRQGKKDLATQFIEDIETANSENIRGNIRLEDKQYELAYGHFKLALQKKADSLNALERSVSLAWLLGQWSEGLDLLDSFIKPEIDVKNKQALRLAFTIKSEDFESAQEELRYLEQLFEYQTPLEVDQMKSYISLRTKNARATLDASQSACRRHDGLNCWIYLHDLTWSSVSSVMEEDKEIHTSASFDLDELKKAPVVAPLQETPILNQRDIEELDGMEVILVPGAFF